jgi:putative copper export protein
VESFHNALYESMSLASKAVTAGRMLQRLAAAISAELTAIESIERRADENRRIRYAVAVGFVSAVAIPASLILAFLGINASQVSQTRSMFSDHYLGMYLTVAGLILLGTLLSAGLWVRQRRDTRQERSAAGRPRWRLADDDFDS